MRRNILLIIASLLISAAVLEVLLRLAGALFLWRQELGRHPLSFVEGEYRILCIGESTTALGGDFSYPSQLQEILNKTQHRYRFVVINKGIPSIDTDVLLDNLPGNITRYHPHMIVAMMGVNDHAFYAPSDAWNRFKVIKLVRLIYAGLKKKWEERFLQSPVVVSKEPSDNPLSLARAYEYNGKYDKAIDTLEAMLVRTTQKDYVARVLILWELGISYMSCGELPQAVKYFQAVLYLAPSHNRAWGDLGETYMLMGRLPQAEYCLTKQLVIDVKEDWYVSELVSCLLQEGRGQEVEPLLLYAIRMDPTSGPILRELGNFYLQQGRWSQAAQVLEKLLPTNPQVNDMVSLKTAYQKMGRQDKAEALIKKYKAVVNFQTQKNFDRLKELAFRNGIALVIMQYPTRDIRPLKAMVGESSKIIFVDNSNIFNRAVAKEGYSAYFIDRFGGNFGHATPKGNSLIAMNLAGAILGFLQH